MGQDLIERGEQLSGSVEPNDDDGDQVVDRLNDATAPGMWTARLRLADELVTAEEPTFTGARQSSATMSNGP